MKPTAGDVIYADRFWYKHYGIYVDKTTVIHYATDDDSSDGDIPSYHIWRNNTNFGRRYILTIGKNIISKYRNYTKQKRSPNVIQMNIQTDS